MSKEEYINRVRSYISIEYNKKLSTKMREKKFQDICKGYISNCYSLKKPIPYTASGIVNILRKTK
jgi:hypothetical protein